MRRRLPFFALFPLLISALLLSGCGGGGSGLAVNSMPTARPTPILDPTPPVNPTSASLALRSVADSWNKAAPRWRDIGNNLFSDAFRAGFSYQSGSVVLTYPRSPITKTFSAHISARGLKPNFAYQLKLAGKPISGPQGWGTSRSSVSASTNDVGAAPVLHNVAGTPVGGDDWTNQQLGYAGRWWDDTSAPSTNLDDAYFRANYPNHTVYGYLFMGDFITDNSGNAEADVRADRSFHITWQDAQNGVKDVLLGTFPLAPSATNYGYSAPLSANSQTLWYELEPGRVQPVVLPSGTYHCRLLVTEEAFHTAGGEGGGVWQTVLATEATGDQNAANDIVFSIG